ncbi:MAG TPA: DUF3179 domain-containing (seleno)protein, partial [Nitrososphaeraceae archaeon]|nr:DUF3179 domain-containing (seleno)protein [Nitrososphaeraceae archaeon]
MSHNNRLIKKNVDKKAIAVIAMLSIFGIILSVIIIVPIINSNPTSVSITAVDNTNSAAVAVTAEEKEKSIVPLDQIVSGGPPPDGIPSIDNPKFISVQEASKFLEDSELVLGLNINGDIRAYPLQILVWHEIVNDKVGGVPVCSDLLSIMFY